MNYTETHAKIKNLEVLMSSGLNPAQVAAEVIKDPQLLEALAALVKQYSNDPRISTKSRQWASKYETCFERVTGGYVSTRIHLCHIDQTALAVDRLQAVSDAAKFYADSADNYLQAIASAIQAVRAGSTTEKGYLLVKIECLKNITENLL